MEDDRENAGLGFEDIHEQGDEPGDWDTAPRVPGLENDFDVEKAEAEGEVVDETANSKDEDAKEDEEFER